jgi:hypothetical protein
MKIQIIISTILLFLVVSLTLSAQEDEIAETIKPKHKAVLNPWFSSTVIDAQTSFTPKKGDIEFIIHHRFTSIDNGISDLFGFYGASNIRLGLNYGITDKLMIGFGTERDKRMQEFLVKYKILQQSRDNVIPVSVAIFANTCINARETDYWGTDYSFTDRLSYYSQIIVSRKWTSSLTTQLGLGYAHINKVDSYRVANSDSVSETITYYPKYYNDALGLSVVGRYKINNTFTVIAEFEKPLALKKSSSGGHYNHGEIPKPIKAKPNVALGFEISTMTHSFQLFASSYRAIIPQNNLIMNNFDITEKNGIMLGFNIVVKF